MKKKTTHWFWKGWHYVRNHWFVSALVVLVFLSVVRNQKWIDLGKNRSEQPVKAEKYTGQLTASSGGAVMGLLGNSGGHVPFPEIGEEASMSFLRRFQHVAQGEQRKFGVPASILLAAAYVNSFAGERPTATEANNFYALICNKEWDGASETIEGACFRKYGTAWESFRDFSISLAGQEWFGEAKRKSGYDWEDCLGAMSGKGISDVEDWESEMKKVIKAYRLFELDVQL